ncbi:hypothetical protein K438DRAFT_2110620, partial [Mycena galopus ATCC 62051]
GDVPDGGVGWGIGPKAGWTDEAGRRIGRGSGAVRWAGAGRTDGRTDGRVVPLTAGWQPGIHLSRTGLSENGCLVDIAIAINVNDLPATRKMLGLAGVGSNHICTVCNCKGVDATYRTDLDDPVWARRDVRELRRWAYAWRDAKTQAERDTIFKHHGVRWSELWRLLYWDPTRMGVVDSMHCILEGLVHYHCRRVLRIDAERELPHIRRIQAKLVQSLIPDGDNDDDSEDIEMPDVPPGNIIPAISEEAMWSALHKNNLPPLRFVAFSLAINLSQIKFIQRVIAQTATPSWINTVPHNYGESNAGTIKADEWRTLSTLYLPLAPVLLWLDRPEDEHSARLLGMLDHSMALFQAVILVCRCTMTAVRATTYRSFLKNGSKDFTSITLIH